MKDLLDIKTREERDRALYEEYKERNPKGEYQIVPILIALMRRYNLNSLRAVRKIINQQKLLQA